MTATTAGVNLGKYLEHMKISDAKKLADSLNIPLATLLDVSISLAQDLGNAHPEGFRERAQFGHSDVAVAV